jgi:hypothetical protein
MNQGFFLRICRVEIAPQNCGAAAWSPLLSEATTIETGREEQRAGGLAKLVKSKHADWHITWGYLRLQCLV